ncbi:unnamed protein product [Vitrella brassicaformis CCMP3155]|uniref:Uncharacterized protein n=1 Tax=Vitrella brassicaformis (strain CCMP3155) TaxID=1169540 RepID=A0A0G4EAF2_VITBC|nr:unnamed protein product [Vitrella brassicaformis CCMP3155]|eukprot:CEL92936.1 unnamed protein product [Vitrella brassicaformis CCMP3155]
MSDAHRSRQGDAAWAATRSDQAVRDPLSQTAYSVASSVSGREASPPSHGHGSGMNNFVPDSSPYRHRAAADSPLSRASPRRLLIRSSRSCVEASDDGHDATCEPSKTRTSARISPSAASMRAGEADGRRPAVRQTDEVASARPVSPALAEMAHPRPFDDEIYVHREPTQATFGRRPTHWVYLRPCPSLPMPAPCDPPCTSMTSNYPPPSGRSLEQDGADASTTQVAWSTLGAQQRRWLIPRRFDVMERRRRCISEVSCHELLVPPSGADNEQ